MLVARESAITPAHDNERLFSAKIMIRPSRPSLHLLELGSADAYSFLTQN
jgi:hypothetical protein